MKKFLLILTTLAALTAHAEETQTTSSSGGWKKAVALGISFTPVTVFNGTATTAGSSGSGKMYYTFDSGVNVGFELTQFDQHSWNNGFQADYTSVKFHKAHIEYAGAEPEADLDGSLQMITLAYSGKYLWETFYLPVGIGFTGSSQSDNGPITDSYRPGGVLWVGAGTVFADNVNAEFVWRMRRAESNAVSFSGYSFDPDRGLMAEFLVSAKILF